MPKRKSQPSKVKNNVIQFPSNRSRVTLSLPADLAMKADEGRMELITIEGTALECIGVYDGEQVLCHTKFDLDEIKPTTPCIVHLRETGETLAKKVEFDDEWVILKSFSRDIEDVVVTSEEVEITAIVARLFRAPSASGSFKRRAA